MRRTILAAGLIFVVLGLAAMVNGWTIVQVERGWAQFIAGSVLLGSGALLVAMSVVVARLEALVSGAVTAAIPASEPSYEPTVPQARPASVVLADEGSMSERFAADAPPSPAGMPLETFRPPVSVEEVAPPIADELEEEPAGSKDKRIPIGALAGAATAAAGATLASTLRRPDTPAALSDTPPPPPFFTRPPPPSFSPPSFPPPSFTPPSFTPPPPFAPPPLPSLMPPPLPAAQAPLETRRAATEFEERLFGATITKPIEAPMPAVQPEFDAPGPNSPMEQAQEEVHETPPAVESEFYAEPEEAPPVLGPVGDAEFSEELEEIRHAPAELEPEPEAAPEIDEMAWLDAALRGVEMPKQPEWAAKPAGEPIHSPPPVPSAAAPEPPPPEAASSEEPEAASKGNIVRTYESQGVIYTLYDNGSVDAETPNGLFHFMSVEELREFLAKSA
jgi:hypothetical protein